MAWLVQCDVCYRYLMTDGAAERLSESEKHPKDFRTKEEARAGAVEAGWSVVFDEDFKGEMHCGFHKKSKAAGKPKRSPSA